MKKLSGKVAIVTGATSGMGRAIAMLFAEHGARVVLSGRDLQRGAEVATAIQRAGGEALFIPGDVGKPETNRDLVSQAAQRFGGVDVLVPNAGQLGLGSVTEVSLETWEATLSANLSSVFYLLHYGIAELNKRASGTVVVNGSIAATRAFPNHAAYCATKGALPALVRQVALDYAPRIRVNLLCPGPVDTPLIWDSAAGFPDPEQAVARVAANTPLGRLGLPRDVAHAALFLACEDSAWITGTSLTIDGGALCR